MASGDVVKFNELELKTSDTSLGHVAGKITLDVMGYLRHRLRVSPFLKKDMSLNRGGYGDVIEYEKLNNHATVETVTTSNYDTAISCATKVIAKDTILLNKMYRVGIKVPGNRAAFSQNWEAANAVFLDDAKSQLAEKIETELCDSLYQNAGHDFTATGTSGSHKYIAINDLIGIGRTIKETDKMLQTDFMGFFSSHDIELMTKAAIADKQPLIQNNWITLGGESDVSYRIFGVNFIEHPLISSVHTESPHVTTYHNLLLNPDHIVLASKSLIPPEVEQWTQRGITVQGMVDDKTGLSFMMTMAAYDDPYLYYTIKFFVLMGIKYKRTEAGWDISSTYAH